MTPSDQPTVYEVPHPDSLTFAQLDDVLELTGIDVTEARGQARIAGKFLAALVVWARHRAGETVDFDTVYRTMTTNDIRVTRVDPTGAAP
jgi:hypothetical protein